MKKLVDYWQHSYDWRTHEAELNRFAQFKADMDGISIHFIHERGKGPNPTPLLLIHGWPDSFYRYHKVIERLTNPAKYGGDPNRSFDAIVPSIPGHGFSARKALSSEAVADLFAKSMCDELGYQRFVAGGGDLGTLVVQALIGHLSMQSHVEELAGAVRTLASQEGVRSDRIFALTNSEGVLHALNYQVHSPVLPSA